MTDRKDTFFDAETRGWALVGQMLSASLLSLLAQRGVISDEDRRFTLERVVAVLEQLQASDPDDRALRVARGAIQALLDAVPRSEE